MYIAPHTFESKIWYFFYIPKYNAPSKFSVKKVLLGKEFRCTLRSDDAVKGAKERLPRKEEEREGKRRRRRDEGIQLKIFYLRQIIMTRIVLY